MKMHYDKKEDALCIRFNNEPYQESEEIRDGIIFDYDKKGKIIAIEILDASKKFPPFMNLSVKEKKFPFTIALAE